MRVSGRGSYVVLPTYGIEKTYEVDFLRLYLHIQNYCPFLYRTTDGDVVARESKNVIFVQRVVAKELFYAFPNRRFDTLLVLKEAMETHC